MSDLFGGDPDATARFEESRRGGLDARWAAERRTKPDRCRSCHAELAWALTDAGRWMPLDAQPDPDGNVRLVPVGMAAVAQVVGPDVTAPGPPSGERWTAHFATCPDADQHRKRRQ